MSPNAIASGLTAAERKVPRDATLCQNCKHIVNPVCEHGIIVKPRRNCLGAALRAIFRPFTGSRVSPPRALFALPFPRSGVPPKLYRQNGRHHIMNNEMAALAAGRHRAESPLPRRVVREPFNRRGGYL